MNLESSMKSNDTLGNTKHPVIVHQKWREVVENGVCDDDVIVKEENDEFECPPKLIT